MNAARAEECATAVETVVAEPSLQGDGRPPRGRYGSTNRIFICYLVCSSVLCVLPMLFYFMASAFYRRKHRGLAAVSMECFLYSHLFLTDTLLLSKVLHIVFSKYPGLLEGGWIQSRLGAALTIAAVCAGILVATSAGWRYYRIYREVKHNKIGLVSALLKNSYLEDIKYGIPTLIVYNSCGPLFTKEQYKEDAVYNSTVAYDVYLYCTSLLLVIPACFAKLCEYLHYRKKERMLSVVRMCASLMHVLLINAALASAVSYAVLYSCQITIAGILQEPLGFSAMCGLSMSALIIVCAVIFCCYVVKKKEDVRLTDGMARTVLKFGFLTLVVGHICKLTLAWEKSKRGGKQYPRDKFVCDLLRFIVSAFLLFPAYLLHIAGRLRKKGKKKEAAIVHKAWEVSYAFLGNLVLLGGVFTGVSRACASFGVDFFVHNSPARVGFLVAFLISVVILAIAVVCDCVAVRRQCVKAEKSWEEVILNDRYTSYNIASFGILEWVIRGFVRMLSCVAFGKSHDSPSDQKYDVVVDSGVMLHGMVRSQ